MKSPLGKWTKITPQNPRAIAVCDYSGMFCRHADLQKQMEYRGNNLVWNGFLVNPKFVDKPNAQMLTPILMPDPIPVNMPRPDTALPPPAPNQDPPSDGVYPKNPAPPTGANYPVKGVYKKTEFY